MPISCNPCECPEQYYRNEITWRKAMITLLCSLIDSVQAQGAGYTQFGTTLVPMQELSRFVIPIDSLPVDGPAVPWFQFATLPENLQSVVIRANGLLGDIQFSIDGIDPVGVMSNTGIPFVINIASLGQNSLGLPIFGKKEFPDLAPTATLEVIYYG